MASDLRRPDPMQNQRCSRQQSACRTQQEVCITHTAATHVLLAADAARHNIVSEQAVRHDALALHDGLTGSRMLVSTCSCSHLFLRTLRA